MRDNDERMDSELTRDQPAEKLPWQEPVVTQFAVTDVTSGASQINTPTADGILYS